MQVTADSDHVSKETALMQSSQRSCFRMPCFCVLNLFVVLKLWHELLRVKNHDLSVQPGR